MAVTAPARSPIAVRTRSVAGRRLATAALLGVLVISLVVALPALRPVVREIREMNGLWVTAAVALEMGSCLSFVVIFRLFFERVAAPDARALAWTSMASGVLLPGGGVGGLAIGGWLMRLAGTPTGVIVRRSSGLFFLTSAVNGAAIMGAGLLLVAGAAGPHDFRRAALPLLVAGAITLAIARAPMIAQRRGAAASWLDGVVAGIRDAQRAVLHPSWRLAGALGYLAFDIAVLWATFSAIGDPPPVPALTLGYAIGYIANALPVPGGAGVLDAGLVGALVLYGAAPIHAAAAVLVYHAIALWVPALGGLLAYARLRPRLTRPATPRVDTLRRHRLVEGEPSDEEAGVGRGRPRLPHGCRSSIRAGDPHVGFGGRGRREPVFADGAMQDVRGRHLEDVHRRGDRRVG